MNTSQTSTTAFTWHNNFSRNAVSLMLFCLPSQSKFRQFRQQWTHDEAPSPSLDNNETAFLICLQINHLSRFMFVKDFRIFAWNALRGAALSKSRMKSSSVSSHGCFHCSICLFYVVEMCLLMLLGIIVSYPQEDCILIWDKFKEGCQQDLSLHPPSGLERYGLRGLLKKDL